MARIASLEVLLTTEGNDFLKEEYGKVIENIQVNGSSNRIKTSLFQAHQQLELLRLRDLQIVNLTLMEQLVQAVLVRL